MHGEADLVDALLQERQTGRTVLDAGCGTGRVAIELARRGYETVGVDLDEAMLETARIKAPELEWHRDDLRDLHLGRTFDVVVAAGNVMIFLMPGSEAAVVRRLAEHLNPGGLLVAGFQLAGNRLPLADYDEHAAAAGLSLIDRFATWGREPWVDGGDYAVSVHGA